MFSMCEFDDRARMDTDQGFWKLRVEPMYRFLFHYSVIESNF